MTNIYTNEIELAQALDSYCAKRSALWNLFFGNRGFDGYGYSFKVPTKVYEEIFRDFDRE